jgi:preprotein translocase subunit SecG
MSILTNILLGIYLFISLLMMLVILMQRPKSEGLGAAFGGGVTENIFGAQTTNVLTKITGWLAAIFFLLTFTLSILYARKGNTQSDLRRELMKGQVPATAPIPAASVGPQPAPETSPAASPGPSSAVGPPGTVTNPAPETTGPAPSVKPADLAVGAVPPATTSSVAPATSPATSPPPSAAPSVSPAPQP